MEYWSVGILGYWSIVKYKITEGSVCAFVMLAKAVIQSTR